jgi:site-specific DNA-cytosine methylase
MRRASRGRFSAVILSAALSEATAYHCVECSLCVRSMTDLVQIPDHTLWLEYTCGNAVPVPVAAAMEKNLQPWRRLNRWRDVQSAGHE